MRVEREYKFYTNSLIENSMIRDSIFWFADLRNKNKLITSQMSMTSVAVC